MTCTSPPLDNTNDLEALKDVDETVIKESMLEADLQARKKYQYECSLAKAMAESQALFDDMQKSTTSSQSNMLDETADTLKAAPNRPSICFLMDRITGMVLHSTQINNLKYQILTLLFPLEYHIENLQT